MSKINVLYCLIRIMFTYFSILVWLKLLIDLNFKRKKVKLNYGSDVSHLLLSRYFFSIFVKNVRLIFKVLSQNMYWFKKKISRTHMLAKNKRVVQFLSIKCIGRLGRTDIFKKTLFLLKRGPQNRYFHRNSNIN